jgi:hypothetical protein
MNDLSNLRKIWSMALERREDEDSFRSGDRYGAHCPFTAELSADVYTDMQRHECDFDATGISADPNLGGPPRVFRAQWNSKSERPRRLFGSPTDEQRGLSFSSLDK